MKESKDTRIDIWEHKGLVFEALKKHRVPNFRRDDMFVDFVVEFYDSYYFKEGDSIPSYIRMRVLNFLSKESKKYHKEKHMEGTIEIHAQHPDFLDNNLPRNTDIEDMTPEELSIYCEEIMQDIPDDVEDWVLSREYDDNGKIRNKGYFADRAKEEGVTRQAVTSRLKSRLQKHIEGLE